MVQGGSVARPVATIGRRFGCEPRPPALSPAPAGRRARRTLDELVTHSYLAGAILDHPDPAQLREVLVEGLGLRELAVPPLPRAAGATVCVGHAAWPGQPLSEWPKVPPSDRFRLSIRPLADAAARRGLTLPRRALTAKADDAMAFLDSALQDAEQSLPPSPAQSSSNAETPTDSAGHGAVAGSSEWLDEVVPAHPLLTVGVVDVDAACARLESLGWATVASPAVSARDPPAEMGLRPDEDSALTAAVVQDACGVQLELIGGFEAPRIASVWAQPPSTERCKGEKRRGAAREAQGRRVSGACRDRRRHAPGACLMPPRPLPDAFATPA